ncbi:MAG TPA: 4-hydroxy-tetrahydrodipicolinate reductase [Ignavibacteria bacterium]|nr:4-hydroxy-tetrahydrodipicolinate reductase [Ignavibacteria bacterium]
MDESHTTNKDYGIFGFSGRLGGEVVTLLNENGYKMVYGRDENEEINDGSPSFLIDCSLAVGFDTNLEIAEKFSVPLIVAATGLTDDQMQMLKLLSEKIPIVQSNNFSYGIQVMLNLIKNAEEKLKDWDIEITETHHRFKKDKPSGTAKLLKNALKKENINISSLRLGNVFGEHTVEFGGLGEVISITHSATSRRTFAEGILKSAQFIVNKQNGFYSFSDVVNG